MYMINVQNGTIKSMEVPISHFRKNLFSLIDQVLEGKEVWVRHKGRRVRIVPEDAPSKLSRITPLKILSSPNLDPNDPALKTKMLDGMRKEWEKDWEKI